MDARFYTFGRGLAPRQWRLNALPYTNRLYVIYGGLGAFLSEEGPVPVSYTHLDVYKRQVIIVFRKLRGKGGGNPCTFGGQGRRIYAAWRRFLYTPTG